MAKISFYIRKKAIEKWHPSEYNINGCSEVVFINEQSAMQFASPSRLCEE